MGFAAEAGLFFWGEKGHFAPKKGVTLHPRLRISEKKRQFFGGGEERGRFAPKKGVKLAPSAGYRFPRKKSPPQAQSKYSHSEYFDPPTYIGI